MVEHDSFTGTRGRSFLVIYAPQLLGPNFFTTAVPLLQLIEVQNLAWPKTQIFATMLMFMLKHA